MVRNKKLRVLLWTTIILIITVIGVCCITLAAPASNITITYSSEGCSNVVTTDTPEEDNNSIVLLDYGQGGTSSWSHANISGTYTDENGAVQTASYEAAFAGWKLVSINGNAVSDNWVYPDNDFIYFDDEPFYSYNGTITSIAFEALWGKKIYVRDPYNFVNIQDVFGNGDADGIGNILTAKINWDTSTVYSADTNSGATQSSPVATLRHAYDMFANSNGGKIQIINHLTLEGPKGEGYNAYDEGYDATKGSYVYNLGKNLNISGVITLTGEGTGSGKSVENKSADTSGTYANAYIYLKNTNGTGLYNSKTYSKVPTNTLAFWCDTVMEGMSMVAYRESYNLNKARCTVDSYFRNTSNNRVVIEKSFTGYKRATTGGLLGYESTNWSHKAATTTINGSSQTISALSTGLGGTTHFYGGPSGYGTNTGKENYYTNIRSTASWYTIYGCTVSKPNNVHLNLENTNAATYALNATTTVNNVSVRTYNLKSSPLALSTGIAVTANKVRFIIDGPSSSQTISNLFAGGYRTSVSESIVTTKADIDVIVKGNAKVTNIYGGGNNVSLATLGTINIEVRSGTITNIYGGGQGGFIGNSTTPGKINIKTTGGTITNIYGAGAGGAVQILSSASPTNATGYTKYFDEDNNLYLYSTSSSTKYYVTPRAKVGSDDNKQYDIKPLTLNGTTYQTWDIIYAYPQISDTDYANYYVNKNRWVVSDALVTADIDIDIGGNTTIKGTVYGGGQNGAVTGDININISDSVTIAGNVYAGGEGLNSIITSTMDKVNYKWTGVMDDHVLTVDKINAMANATGSVFSKAPSSYTDEFITGSELFGSDYVHTDGYVYIYTDAIAKFGIIDGNTTINIENASLTKSTIFAGSNGSISKVTGDATATIKNSTVKGIYGGGNAAEVGGSSTVTISNSNISADVYGGCNTADVLGNITLNMDGTNAVGGSIYGGCNDGIAGVVNATISGTKVTGNVYAGGNQNNATRTSLIMSDSSAAKIFGGGNVGNINLYTVVDLTNVTATEVFGGGYEGDIGDTTDVIINSGTYTRVFGGCDQGEVMGSTTTKVGTIENPNIVISDVLYGGGRGVDSNGDGDASDFTTVWGTANVTITGMNTRVENYGSTKLGSVAGNVNVDFINYRNNNATKPYITMNGIDRATKVSLENSYIALENMGADGKKEGIKNIGTLEVPEGSGLKVTADSEITNDFIGGGYFYLDSEVTLIVGGDITGTTELVINPQLTDATSDVDSPLVIKGGLENAYLVVKGSSDASNIICKDSRYGSRQKYVHGTGEGDFATVTAGYFYIDGDVRIDEQIENIIASIDGKDYHGTTDTWTEDVVIYQDGMFTANMNISYNFSVATENTTSYRNVNRHLTIKEAGVGGTTKYFPAGTQITMIVKDAEGNITIYKKSITSQTQKVSLNDFVNVEDENDNYTETNNIVEDTETSIEGSTATSIIYKREEEYRFVVDFTYCTNLVPVGEYILHFDIYNGAYQLSALQDAATNVVELKTARSYSVALSTADNSYVEQSNIPITSKIVIGASTLAGKDRFAEYPLYALLTVKDPNGNLTNLPDGTVITVNGVSNTLSNGAIRIELLDQITESARNETIVINVDMTACADYQLQSGIYTFNFDVYLKDTEAQKTLVNKTFNIMLNRKDENYSVDGKFFETIAEAMSYIETNNMTTATIKVEIGKVISMKGTVETSTHQPRWDIGRDLNITLDLNGKTSILSGDPIQNFGTFTVKGKGILQTVNDVNATTPILIVNFNKLNVEDATLINYGVQKTNTGTWTGGAYYTILSKKSDVMEDVLPEMKCVNATIRAAAVNSNLIEGTNSAAINIGSGTINLENTVVTSEGTGIITYTTSTPMTVNINGGSITSVNEGVLEIAEAQMDVTITGNAEITSSTWHGIRKLGTGSLTIGTDDGVVSDEAPVIQGVDHGLSCDNCTFNYYDGLIISDTETTISKQPDNIPVGYRATQRTEDSLYVTYLKDIRNCMYNGTYYETLDEAYIAINDIDGNSGTIDVLRDYTETGDANIPVMGETVTINTNGYTVTRTGVINVPKASLTITGSGKITSSGANTFATSGTGLLNIQGATIANTNATGSAINVAGGSVNLKSGSITSSGTTGVNIASGTFTMGTYEGNKNNMSITAPTVTSEGTGIQNVGGSFNLYDGRIKGKTASYTGTVTAREFGYDVLTTTDAGYYVSYLAGDITPPVENRVFVDSTNASEVGYKVTITDNGEINNESLKYIWTTKTSGITAEDMTQKFVNGQTIVGPFATTGTYYLWTVASDADGNTTLSGPGTPITFENPRIEIGQKDLGVGMKELTVFAYNRENIYENELPQTSNGATTTQVASQYENSTAWKLDKTGVGLQKHYLDGVYENKFSGLAEDTYVVVASDYKTTNAAGVENFTATNIYKPGKAGTYLADNVLSNLGIIDDGNFHHAVNVIKLNQETAAANAEISSGLPNWDSTSAGSMTVDGIQWYTIPASELSNGVGTIKWAYGDKDVSYFATEGNEISNLGTFKVAQDGTYTAYMKTPSGKEVIQKIEVTSVDETQAFTIMWDTGLAGKTFIYPVQGNVDVVIDWGDGTASAVTSDFPSHTYEVGGTYEVKIYGSADMIGLVEETDRSDATYGSFIKGLQEITNWGEGNFKRFGFTTCLYLTSVADNATEKTFANVTSMENMFRACMSLENLNLKSFNTSNVTNMAGMFFSCNALETIDVSSFDTSKVTNMSEMFSSCEKLTSIDLSSWDVKALQNASGMFEVCNGLKVLDLRNFNTSSLTTTDYMFAAMENLEKIIVSDDFNVSKVTSSEDMFYYSQKLVGGAGTTYDNSKVDVSMANIDTVADPGYFTKVQYEVAYEDGTTDSTFQTIKMAVNAITNSAGKSGTITPLVNATDDIQAVIPSGTTVTLNLNGKTITILDNNAESFIENNGTLKLQTTTGSINYAGAVDLIVIENNGTLNLGTNDGTVSTSAPAIKGGTYAVYGNVDTTNFYDGVLKGTVAPIGGKYTTPDTYAVKTVEETIDGTKYYKGTLDLGSYTVGSKYYYSLKDAIDAIETTGTIKVYKNNTDTYLATVPSGKTITLDLNGKTITKTTNNIVVDGELTITDSTATPGTITGSLDVMFEADMGTITFEKGNFTQTKNNGTLVRSATGTINVVEATMKSNGDAIVSTNTATINIGNSATEISKEIPLIMANNIAVSSNISWNWYDGILKAKQTSIYTAIPNAPMHYTPESGEQLIDGDTYYTTWLVRDQNYEINGNFYATLADILAAETGGTITLLRNCTDDSVAVFQAGSSFKIDLGEFTMVKTVAPITAKGSLEIKGEGNINSRIGILDIDGGEVTLSSSIKFSLSQEECAAIRVISGTLNIKDSVSLNGDWEIIEQQGGLVNLYGGTINSMNTPISIEAGTFNMYGGTIINVGGLDCTVINTGTFHFEGGIVKSAKPESPFRNPSQVTTLDSKEIYYYTDGSYNCARVETGWDISAAQDGSIYAYLIPNGSDYTLEVVGEGMTSAYGWTPETAAPWYEYRNSITALEISEGITGINAYLFAFLSKIKSVVLPETLSHLGTCAFLECTSLTADITIPANVKDITGNPFVEIPLTNMIVAAGNTKYKVSNNMLMTIDGTRVITYFIGIEDKIVEIPAGVTSLALHSLQGAKAEEITLPSTLTTIEQQALRATKLKELVIPASVVYIENNFVANSSDLAAVYFLGTNFEFTGANQFLDIAENSAIYTRSAEVASKFTDGTHYNSSNTTVYYPPVVSGTLLDTTVNSMKTVTFEVTPTPGVPETIKYIWEVKRVGTDTWVALMDGQGLNTAKYTTAQLTVANSGDEFRCTINNIDGTGTTIYPNIYMPITDSDMTTKLISDTAKVYVRAANYEVNGEFFATLEDAVAAVPAGTATTIKLLTNMEDNSLVTIPADRNVTLNIQGFTLNRKDKVITNNGTMNITGTGTLKVESATLIDNKGTLKITQDAINVVSTSTSAVAIINSGSVELNKLSLTTAYTALKNTSGTVKVSGGTIIVDGKADVTELSGWLIEGGTVEILGGTLDINNTKGTVINLDVKSGATLNVAAGSIVSNNTAIRNNGGTVTVTGGEISADDKGIENLGTSGNVTIGIDDGSVYDDNILITSKMYGYYSDNSAQLSFFDGTIEGVESAVYNRTAIKPIITPDEYDINYSESANVGYETATLVRANYRWYGSWFATLEDIIDEMNSRDAIWWDDIDVYAGENFTSIVDTGNLNLTGIPVDSDDIPLVLHLVNGVTIDFEKQITVGSNVSFKIVNDGAVGTINATVVNNGTLDLKANLVGTLTNNGTATIGATSGTLVNTVSGSITNTGAMTINKTTVTGTITSSGSALTLNGGTLNGGVTMSSGCKFTMTSGAINKSNGVAVTNSGTGAIEILSGSITGTTFGINNTGTGTITIGSLTNGVISSGDPIITGGTYGVRTGADFNFYDGMLRGKTGSYTATVTAVEEGTHIKKDTPEVNGTDYHRAYIENNDVFVEVWDISKTAGTDEVYAGIKVVAGDGVNADTRYKLVVWGTGATKDFELVYTPSLAMRVSTAPWIENYKTKIVTLELEDGVTVYGDYTFYGLTEVRGELVIPETIEKLGLFAFGHLYSITGNIHIPEKLVEMMDTNPFVASNNSSFTVDADNSRYVVENGALYDMAATHKWLIAYPNAAEAEEVIVKEGIIRIGGSAFYRNQNVKKVILPDSMLQIGNSAFSQSAIETIEIPSSVKYIYGSAFSNASSLKTVYLKSTSFTQFTSTNTFIGLAPNSIIYTESKEIADLFVPGTTYTTANTSIYYPFKVLEMPEDFELAIDESIKIEPTIRAGNPTDDVVYQWYLNGNPIAGATSAIYTKPNVEDSDSGDYQVLIKSVLQEDGTYYYSHMSEKTHLRVRDHVGPESVSIAVSYFDDDDGVGFAQVKVTASDSYSGVDKFYVNGAELTTGVDITNDGTGLTGGTGVAVFNIKTKGTYTISVADAEDNRTERTLNAYLISYLPGTDHQLTGNTKSQIHIGSFASTIRISSFAKAGHAFTGWKDQDATLYSVADINSMTYDFDKDMQLTAQWQINTYVVEFWNDAGNGPQLVAIELYEYESKINVPELQYHVAEMSGENQYKIYRHKNNWKATTHDDQSVFKAEDINADNINSIWMVDSDVRYDAVYEVTTYDVGNATVYIDGEMSVSGTDAAIQNDEGLVYIGIVPTIYGPIYNNNGLVFNNSI